MQKNDNRNYQYDLDSRSSRDEYPIIASLVKNKSSVIDLGCGDGSLLKLLIDKQQIKAQGLEISESGIVATRKKGLSVKQGRIDQKLLFKNNEFDYAICNVTLQMVMYPEILLKEMQRISKRQIISFPNFAFILNRLELLAKGRMPHTMIPGYSWYSTGHIHQLSIKDFRDFCHSHKIKIISENHIFPESIFGSSKIVLNKYPNLFASTAIFMTQ